jgi:cell pole-organizing protein PopZ
MSDKALNMEPNPDPSMEEILASIKRVISEDKRPGAAPQPRARPANADGSDPDSPEDDVLELNAPVLEDQPLMSDERAAATRQSLAALAAARQQPGALVEEGPLEAAVREMLRPMLKQWLDERLPGMIEDMVAREISRITGQRF